MARPNFAHCKSRIDMAPDEFALQCSREIAAQGVDKRLLAVSRDLHNAMGAYNYFYHFSWAGMPILQTPQDIVQLQELVWRIQPDLIIETGIARGGSLILYASLLALNATCGGPQDAKVLGIDIDIRKHNRVKIEAHPLFNRVSMIEGSSISQDVIDKVRALAHGKDKVLVCLDSQPYARPRACGAGSLRAADIRRQLLRCVRYARR